MIDLNATFFMQFVNFVITLVVLNFILIKPIRGIIAQRNSHMSEMVDNTEKFTASAEEKLKNYQKQLDEARVAGTERRNGLKAEGTAKEKGILSAAGEQAAATLKTEREAVASEVNTAMGDLKSQVGTMADKVAAKVLG